MEPIDPSDAELIARSRTDPEAFGRVFERHARAVHAFLARRQGRQAADDVLGEVFATAFARRRRYDLHYPDARPWLYGIAHNLLRSHGRRERRQEGIAVRLGGGDEPASAWDDVDARLDAARQTRLAASALAGLPAGERDVLQLAVWEDLPLVDVARVLGIPQGTARSRMHRARTALRAALDSDPLESANAEHTAAATAIPDIRSTPSLEV